MLNKVRIPFFYLLIGILFIVQSYFYVNHISNDYKLMNEYRYIDEITLLNGKEVINSEYIDKKLLFNPMEKKEFTSTNNIYFYNSSKSSFYFGNTPDFFVIDNKSNDSELKKGYNFDDILYNNEKQILYTDKSLANKTTYFTYYPMFQADSIDELNEKMMFIRNNIYEQNMQIMDRYYFHENSFMLSPLNEIALDRNKKEIFSQYGFFSISAISFIMDIYGGFSINNYEKSKKTIDQLYYIIGIIFIFIFFKDNYLKIGFVLILGISFFGYGYYAFSYAPTVTNSRHFLDLFIILFIYFFSIDSKYKNIYLFIAIILSILSVFVAKDFGQFILLSMIGTLFIFFINDYLKSRKEYKYKIFIFFSTLSIGFLSLKYYPLMENPSVKYFLNGFYSFPFTSSLIYFLVLFIVFMQWFLLITLYNRLKVRYLNTYIFIILYTQFLYTYFIWHGSINNIIIYSYLFILPFMIIYNLFEFRYKSYLSLLIIIFFTLFYVKSFKSFIIAKENYDNVFNTHKLYKWDNERAGGIISTYSFDSFQNSIDLIRKYNLHNEIYMISKYDNVLAILSEKYSGFPFFELRSTIVTKEEYNQIKSIIKSDAEMLFIDNDIDRDFDEEMKKMSFFDLEPLWRNESLKQRIPKLETLKKLFNDVKDDYELVEKGKLISVYKRK